MSKLQERGRKKWKWFEVIQIKEQAEGKVAKGPMVSKLGSQAFLSITQKRNRICN